MAAGVGVMLVVLGFLGRWEGAGFLAWLGIGLLTLARWGERVAVRLGCGFRLPSPEQAGILEPVWRRILACCRVPGESVDLYVQRSPAVNAYAVGGRSVAVTSGILTNYEAGNIDARAIEAVLAHELGHSRTNAARFLPITLWFALPWRLFYRAVLRASLHLVGRQPRCLLAGIVLAGFGVATVQAVRQGAWSTVAILGALVVFGLGAPVADAALSRASERAADRFAAEAGYGEDLARALRILDPRPARRRRLSDRVLDSHPDSDLRIEQLRYQSAEARPRSADALIAA
ncbi:MAG: M48 family metalloprotease [Actinobacteria bacterium]|nr:M48 family metalloprotease [Actinomycetota bacterium]